MATDETKGSKDNSSATPGGSSGGTKGTSKDKGKLYTTDDIAKIRSDAAAEAGRQRKAAETERDSLKQQLQDTNSRLDNLEREQNDSRLAAARDDPAALSAYQRDQGLTKKERELADKERDIARREAQVKEDQEQLNKDKATVSVAYVAAKHGLDAEELESLGINDPDILEKVAEKIATGKPSKAAGEGDEGEDQWSPDTHDNEGGGGGPLTADSVESSSIAAVEKALDKTSEK